MFYEQKLTIPKNTALDAYAETTFPIHPGVIQQVTIEIPLGCEGLVGVRILMYSHQFWPANPDSWFTGDDMVLTFPEDLEVVDPPYTVTIQGYNLDDRYEHGPIVRMQLLPKARTLPELLRAMSLGPQGPIIQTGGR